MISHKHRCIFVHIPRTGGSSIEHILWPGSRSVDDLWMGFTSKYRNKYQTGGLQHLFARHIRKEIGSVIFNEYFKFSFVRNPWDKAVSQFHYMKMRKDLRDYIGMDKNDAFKRYLGLIQNKVHVQWEEQHKFILDKDENILVDYIGQFESLQDDFNKICEKIGLPRQKIPHIQKTRHMHYTEYYDDETKAIVTEKFKKDIDYFGYKYGE